MTPSHPSCESILLRISDSLDDATPLTADERSHIDRCEECSRFLELWTHDIPDVLDEAPPPVNLELRHRVLSIPAAARTATVRDLPSRQPPQRFLRFIPAAAAIAALAAITWSMLDIRPASPAIAKPSRTTAAEQELAALKDDFRSSLLAIRQPVESLNRQLAQ